MADGFNAVGISQGGLLLRFLVTITFLEFKIQLTLIRKDHYHFHKIKHNFLFSICGTNKIIIAVFDTFSIDLR